MSIRPNPIHANYVRNVCNMSYMYNILFKSIKGKFHQNPLKTVGGDAETRSCLWTDGWTEVRTDESISIVPFDLLRGGVIKLAYDLCMYKVKVILSLVSENLQSLV